MPDLTLGLLVVMVFAGIGLVIVVLITISVFSAISDSWIKHHTALRPDKPVNDFPPTVQKDDYFQEPPWNGPLTDITSMVEVKLPQQLWDAYILYWVNLGYIRFVPGFKTLQLSFSPPPFGNELEQELWEAIVSASGGDQLLDPNEIPRYFVRYMNHVYDLRDRVKKHSEKAMDAAGMTRTVKKRFLWKKYDSLQITPEGQQLVDRCQAFKNYLAEFSLIKNRAAVEVTLWNQYMVWAAFFGIALEARKGTGTLLNIQALLDNLS